jgi:hypothetical protein
MREKIHVQRDNPIVTSRLLSFKIRLLKTWIHIASFVKEHQESSTKPNPSGTSPRECAGSHVFSLSLRSTAINVNILHFFRLLFFAFFGTLFSIPTEALERRGAEPNNASQAFRAKCLENSDQSVVNYTEPNFAHSHADSNLQSSISNRPHSEAGFAAVISLFNYCTAVLDGRQVEDRAEAASIAIEAALDAHRLEVRTKYLNKRSLMSSTPLRIPIRLAFDSKWPAPECFLFKIRTKKHSNCAKD